MSLKTENIKKKLAGQYYMQLISSSNNFIHCTQEFDNHSLSDYEPYIIKFFYLLLELDEQCVSQSISQYGVKDNAIYYEADEFTHSITTDCLQNSKKCFIHFMWLLDHTQDNATIDVDLSDLSTSDKTLETALKILSNRVFNFNVRADLFGEYFDIQKLYYLEDKFEFSGYKYETVDDLLDELENDGELYS